ncbi:type II secretion system protein [Ruminiclostridium herbifermentans]|uniref:Type II secretion system protein n=1 Tax=Ruminiclostridium herbifermentans TaxID=2488810 RepID=A0A4U7J8F5_9FIRM|nr:type II secretion system protein [Ruminiclostridium herbifermentans]QNU68117.1 type II secretion system protein [Ruminiclostridium herbifermentans]
MKNKLRIFKTEKGATFVEIMLAVAILVIIAVPLLSTVIASVKNNATAKEKTEAIALAEMAMGNIKAQTNLMSLANLTTTSSAIYVDLTNDKLETHYIVKEKGKAEVSKDTRVNYNYGNEVNKKFDLEFVVNQDKVDNDGLVDITVNDCKGNEIGTISEIDIGSILRLYVGSFGSDYKFSLACKGHNSVFGDFSPQKTGTKNNISIKVTYEGKAVSPGKLLKIELLDDTAEDDSLTIYLVDSSNDKLDIKFIPIGNKDSFILAYIASDAFENNNVINHLFEITVIIKRATDKEVIYSVSSYVRK